MNTTARHGLTGTRAFLRAAAARASRYYLLLSWVALGSLVATPGASASEHPVPVPRIQLALLLDTSNSMDGLIEQAKSQLWRVANVLTAARYGERRPTLEVALYEYGNSGLTEASGWIRQVQPLSNDLDSLSEALFGLHTQGGDEYCGVVVTRALDELDWSSRPEDLKAIFIAGNEAFNQGPVDYRGAATRAVAADIQLSTIFCGDRGEGVSTFWQDGAMLALGGYFFIDQHQQVQHIAAPQDEEIARLGAKLNATYIPYGPRGSSGQRKQLEQDNNAIGAGRASHVERQLVKGSALYCNSRWDLVDACRTGAVSLKEIGRGQLPAIMQGMNLEERQAYVASKEAERSAIQEQIAALNRARKAYLAAHRKDAPRRADTLDTALVAAVKKMALDRGFSLD